MRTLLRRVALAASALMLFAAVPLAPTAADPVANDYGTITGSVTRASDGLPVAGAKVIVHDDVAGAYVTTVTTNPDGTYSTGPLPPSQYQVVPFAPGLALAGDGYRAALVRPHTDIAGIDFSLDPSSALTGTVQTNTGTPVSNARVYLLKKSAVDAIFASSTAVSWTLVSRKTLLSVAFGAVGATDFRQAAPGLAFTAANGTYTIDGIIPGTYIVRTSAPGRGAPADQTITISAGANQLNPTFPTGTTLEGSFLYGDGSPAVGRMVIAAGGGLEDYFPLPPSMTAFADSAGHYTIVGVRPSLYTVRAEGLAADVYGEQSFQVTAATKDLTIDFATAGVNSIEGVVRDAYGSPMGNVNVYVGTNSAPYSLATTTDVNGHYFFDGLQPDSFTISLDRPGYTQPLGDQTVVVPDTGAKAPPVVADMSLARNHWIFGYILDPDGKPVPNGFITNAISASYYVPYVADSDGGFVITSEYAQSQLVAENADYAASLLLPTDLSTNDVIANLQLRPLSDATIPAAPSAQVYGGVESIFVSGFPTTDGGNLITKVTATVSPGGRSCSLLLTSCTITGLKDDTVYKVTIYATNKIGTGIPLVLTVRTKPIDIPRYILSHRGKNGAAVIVFKAPGRPGAIKNYTLRYIDRGKWKIYKHKPWTHSPITVSGLKARTTFTGTLQAIPKVGKSARSGPFYFTTG